MSRVNVRTAIRPSHAQTVILTRFLLIGNHHPPHIHPNHPIFAVICGADSDAEAGAEVVEPVMVLQPATLALVAAAGNLAQVSDGCLHAVHWLLAPCPLTSCNSLH